MNTPKKLALKVVKGIKYAIIPIYILAFLIMMIVASGQTEFLWIFFGIGILALYTVSIPICLFGALLWTQYILEGYVKGTAKIVRCVSSFLLSAIGILYTVGWIMYMTGGWDFAIATKYMPTIHLLFGSVAPAVAVAVLFLLIYPIILSLEAVYRKKQRICEPHNTLLSD